MSNDTMSNEALNDKTLHNETLHHEASCKETSSDKPMHDKTLVYTTFSWKDARQFYVAALLEDGKVMELDCHPVCEESVLGNIYVARVQRVVHNLKAAFVEIQKGVVAYLPFSELKNVIFTKKISKKEIAQGEELLVQVTRDAVKTKEAVVSADISLHGRFCVVDFKKGHFTYSKKITSEQKKTLSFEPEDWMKQVGIIVRTEAATVEKELVYEEMKSLSEKLLTMKEQAVHKNAFSLVYEQTKEFPESFFSYPFSSIQRIVTDIPEVYENLRKEVLTKQEESVLSYYLDSYSLANRVSLFSALEKALAKVVWLKSGANLIIEPTEAMTVIDVNSSKNCSKKDYEENVLKINLEAAKEIARQLRLRNLSGIILVDFINMRTKEEEDTLIDFLKKCLKEDRIQTTFVDMTRLGLVEITRKKYRKSLREQVNYD